MNVTHIKIGVELDFLKNVSENSPYGSNLNLYVIIILLSCVSLGI